MKTHTEASVDPKYPPLLEGAARDGLRAIGLHSGVRLPSAIIEALDQYVFNRQQKKLPPDQSLSDGDAPFALGALWGQQWINEFGWHWAKITFHQHNNTVAIGIISSDASLAIYPIHFVLGCLKNRGVDVTIMLAFNMLKARKLPSMQPGQYSNLMQGVRRIVPRT